MNDLINDLNKLYDLNAISFTLEPNTFQDFQNIISPMIKEKEEIIKSFEKQIPLHIYLVDNFSECDGCNNLFNEDEIIPSIQEPYYVCQNCETDLKKQMEI